ncbi:MAG TPA: hypothetical protein VHU88_21540 [Sporichthyaceae bacterium]|jgi:translation initiation factor IF-2|nr:hypothetical protein [Sporichthyaceae bacterium]
MRNSWKLWTTIGAGLLVVAGPSATGAAAADVPSPQSGVSQPNPDGPPNAYNPGMQADGGQTSADSTGGPQTGKEMQPPAPKPATTAENGRQVTTPDFESKPGSNQPAPSALPADRAGKQAPAAPADPNFPADPKMPSAGDDGSDMNVPNVTAPGEGPGPVGPTA